MLSVFKNYSINRAKAHKILFFMKRFLLLMCALFALVCVPVFAQDAGNPDEIIKMGFETFSALIALVAFVVPFVIEGLKRWFPNASSLVKQIVSWIPGVILALAGYFLNFGFLADVSLWVALLYGLGAGLIANGIFDTGVITSILGFLGIKEKR